MNATAQGAGAFPASISARRSPEQDKRARRVFWEELLTSLWAPVSIFGIAFLLYLLVIELNTQAHLVARPLLKGFGALMVAAFFGLWFYRLAFRRARVLRRLREEAREQNRELERVLARHRRVLDPAVVEKLLHQGSTVDAIALEDDPERLSAELKKQHELLDKHLGAFRRRSPLDFVSGFAKALAIALLIRGVVLEPFKIPSGSMIPTLEIGDQIFVNKFIYGVRIPYLNYVPFQIVRPPARGDVIVFNNPVDTSKDFIKRVIGIPGDEVKIVDETIYINGVAQPRKVLDPSYVYYDQDGDQWSAKEAVHYLEEISGHAYHTLREPFHPNAGRSEGPYRVPMDHVFVLGDNRDNSYDSRYGLGQPALGVQYVPYPNIKGKAMVIWLSLSHDGFLSGLFGGTGLRTDRLFLPVR